ncbi:Pr6Pr family membrane protein [Microcella daejeonensis]|uniref:Pr6Pr family membrane protein n=1 Tax=Microcella daejeonensis TaxID=2994971 RepID=UPI00226DCB66|nr:Pr6Pr family membrane protein [Microcella daejeonensis]WAB83183.1 Pr6Pr family membrane protein [Microcella daejeonensis]
MPTTTAHASSPVMSRAGVRSLRRGLGALSALAGLAVLAAVITQVSDQIAAGRFEADEYFQFFTIQTALINVVVLLAGGVEAFRRPVDTLLYTAVRASAVAYAVVTGLVYNVLLRGIPNDDGYVGPVWPNELLHVWIPVYIALEFLVNPTRARLGWGALGLAVSFPLAWVGVTMVRGAVEGWYPYPFLEPDGPNGVGGVVGYVVGIAVLIIGLAAITVLVTRAQHRASQ